MTASVKEATEKTSQVISDGLEHENTKKALDLTKKAANAAAGEVTKVGKEVVQSDMFKAVATGTVIGAAAGTIVPIPLVGTTTGGLIGAGLGLYTNLTRRGERVSERPPSGQRSENLLTQQVDVYDQLIKFDELRQKGIITTDEFEAKKRALLKIND